MSNIYYLNENNNVEDYDKNDPDFQIPSVTYVRELIKKLQDILNLHINSKASHTDLENKINEINFDELIKFIELPVSNDNLKNIDIKSINTDANHKFITNTQLSIMKDKVSTLELQSAMMDLRNEFKLTLSQYYTNLLNDKDALNKIKDIDLLLKNNKNMSKLLNAISTKVSRLEMNEHIKSYQHLNNNDRKALNLLLSFIKEGCADWNATKDQPNYIRNKPESLPANGGNADTISGYEVKYLLNHQLEDLIIGSNDNIKERIDFLANGENSMQILINYINNKKEGIYSFCHGKYNSKNIIFNNELCGNVILRGAGNRNTIFNINEIKTNGYITFENLAITQSDITIESYTTYDNVLFDNCDILVNSANEINIRNCIFYNCSFSFSGSCFNNMIVNNRFKNSGKIAYYGGNNIIENNLFY